jgi:hypothetical protein
LCGTKKVWGREERSNHILVIADPSNDATRVSYAYNIKSNVEIKEYVTAW